MNIIAPKKPARISAEEMERRRNIVRYADAHNRIEGLTRGPETEAIFDAFINGEIEMPEMLPRLKAIYPQL